MFNKTAKVLSKPTHNPVAVANEFVALAAVDRIVDINPAKLHALVYMAQGWHLGVNSNPLLNGRVSAWRDGVFVPELREAGCWGTKRVETPISVVSMDDARGIMAEQTPRMPSKHADLKTVEAVWKLYGRLPSFDLVRVTKEVASPWDLIWNDEERPNDEPKVIPNATMKIFFKQLADKRRSKVAGITETLRLHPTAGIDQTQPMLETPDPNRLRAV